MDFAEFSRDAAAAGVKRFVESTEALEASVQCDAQNRVVRCDKQPLSVGYAVLVDEGRHCGSKRFSEQCHRIVGVDVHCFGDRLRRQRLLVVLHDVTGDLISPRQRRHRSRDGPVGNLASKT